MALTIANIKRWWSMLTGKSILHVNQDVGKSFSTTDILGYYNNLIEKVTRAPELLGTTDLPKLKLENGTSVLFPVAIYQYGLGAYDLFLQTKSKEYLDKFSQCVEWAIKNQEETGAWNNFFYIYPEHPFGAMCQGEGASLLIRAYAYFKDEKYLAAARKAIDFMLIPREEGGTAKYQAEKLILLEYTHKSAVFNGWIFALFGLYDISMVYDEGKIYRCAFEKSVNTLKDYLALWDNGYWSLYDMDKLIASPFYHNLHVAQLEALYSITKDESFEEYRNRFYRYQNKWINKSRAFVVKALQKITE